MPKIIDYVDDSLQSVTCLQLFNLPQLQPIQVTVISGSLYSVRVMTNDDVNISHINLNTGYSPLKIRYDIPNDLDMFNRVNNVKRILLFVCKADNVEYEKGLFIPYRNEENIYIKGIHDINVDNYLPLTTTFLGDIGWYNKAIKDSDEKIPITKIGDYLVSENRIETKTLQILDSLVKGYKTRYFLLYKSLRKYCVELGIQIVSNYYDFVMVEANSILLYYIDELLFLQSLESLESITD